MALYSHGVSVEEQTYQDAGWSSKVAGNIKGGVAKERYYPQGLPGNSLPRPSATEKDFSVLRGIRIMKSFRADFFFLQEIYYFYHHSKRRTPLRDFNEIISDFTIKNTKDCLSILKSRQYNRRHFLLGKKYVSIDRDPASMTPLTLASSFPPHF